MIVEPTKQEKEHARYLMRKAIFKGILVRSKICQFCEKEKPRIGGHHYDYSKPLEVIWLCPSCHLSIGIEDISKKGHEARWKERNELIEKIRPLLKDTADEFFSKRWETKKLAEILIWLTSLKITY